MRKIFFVTVSIFFITSSIIAQTKEEKKVVASKQYEAMQVLINTGAYEFEGEWASSYSGRKINLISNPNFIKIDTENAQGFLPFFGTSQVAGYGVGGSIEFNSEIENYTVKFNDKKQKVDIKFTVKGEKSENFDISITVFGNLNSNVNVYSSSRSSMSYSGEIKALEEKKDIIK